ncbi:unnamed protein product [Notodromas monacha]|uniref:G2/mitotic-specific cyclin-B3 n=1 Tax=Notodromas monacha TaxID=399045 RepID=A0A7R9BEX5_9CRUS|nr:unnamed protein product [Notodromas monacha]CAG0912565.1 unnamed protein product [Notodromas monacha]
MGPIRATRAIVQRPVVKSENENYAVDKKQVVPRGAVSKLPLSNRVLGEVTNNGRKAANLMSKPPVKGVSTRRAAKEAAPVSPLVVNPEIKTPSDDQESTSEYITPGETFSETKYDDVEEMEVDTSTSCFVGSRGRTIDLSTGKELQYDLSKVIDYDSQNVGKIEEYSCYVEDVFRYYRQREIDPQFAVDPQYIIHQKNINWAMRSILVDWIVDLQESFALCHETLYLAVKIVDLYLTKSQKVLPMDKLQLLGITSVFISSKFEERTYTRVDDLVYMTEDSYTASEVFTMEVEVMQTIGFQLGFPMSYRFLRRFAKTKQLTMQVLTLARYILESSLLDNAFLGDRESLQASGALYLAMKMTNPTADPWDDTAIHYSGVDKESAKKQAIKLNGMLRRPKKNCKTVQTKYEHEVFMKVALITKISDDVL